MLVQTIIQYMASHRRLVVPQLGAFMAKPDGSVVFSELLRTDDGALREALCATGLSELEAAGVIDRFVFEVRHAVQVGEKYTLEGFGTLMPGPNATTLFAYNPQHSVAVEPSAQESTPAPQHYPSKGGAEDAPREQSTPVSEMEGATSGASTPEALAEQPSAPHITPSVKMQPESYVKGLRYGKPEKTTNAYTYVNRAPRRKGFDKLLLLAVVAAVLALAVIAYGYIREYREAQAQAPVELPLSEPTHRVSEPTDHAAEESAVLSPEPVESGTIPTTEAGTI